MVGLLRVQANCVVIGGCCILVMSPLRLYLPSLAWPHNMEDFTSSLPFTSHDEQNDI